MANSKGSKLSLEIVREPGTEVGGAAHEEVAGGEVGGNAGSKASGEEKYEPRGVENPRIVDLIGMDEEMNEVVLSILEGRPWETSGTEQLQQLEDKLNNYLDYVLDGFLGQQYPDYAGLPVCIRLDCAEEPGEHQSAFLEAAGRFSASRGIRFMVRTVKDPFAGTASWE